MVGADGLDDGVGSPAAGAIHNLRHRTAFGGVDGLGSEGLGPRAALRNEIDREDSARTEHPDAAKRHQTNGSTADDCDGCTRPDVGAEGTEVARGQDVGEQDGLLVGDAVRDL